MGRLIDYDVLLKDVQNTITAQSDTMDWLNMISRQPTAFDVEKDVADLEQLKIEAKKKNYKRDISLDMAIEIVKGEI